MNKRNDGLFQFHRTPATSGLPRLAVPMIQRVIVMGGVLVSRMVISAFAVLFALLASAQAPLSEMVDIPAGPFMMGSNHGPEDERPAHPVTLAAFLIDRFPVTNTQYANFLSLQLEKAGATARLYDYDDPDARIHRRDERWLADPGFENHPVVEVPWLGAVSYCAVNGKRLPTEAEWEKAARGTDGRRYPWGSELPERGRGQFAAGWNETAPVNTHPAGASPYGVREMAGNVWQWVSSAYRPYPYSATDGREDLMPGLVRATRGGGHDSQPGAITTTQRGRDLSRNPAAGHHNIGFRCAR